MTKYFNVIDTVLKEIEVAFVNDDLKCYEEIENCLRLNSNDINLSCLEKYSEIETKKLAIDISFL